MLLYPDQLNPQQPDNDTVCFAAPIYKDDWEYLRQKAQVIPATGQAFVIIEGEEVYFMRNNSEITDRVCVLLRDNEDPDTCVESAAWIRIQENFPGMIYICLHSSHAEQWQHYAAAIGALESSVCMIDLDVFSEED